MRLFEKRFDLRDLSAPALGGMGTCDDILRLSEKSPNSVGLKCLGLSTDPVSILKGVESGRIQALVMMENDPLDWGGEAFQKAVAKVPLSILVSAVMVTAAISGWGFKITNKITQLRRHIATDWVLIDQIDWTLRLANANPSMRVPDPKESWVNNKQVTGR